MTKKNYFYKAIFWAMSLLLISNANYNLSYCQGQEIQAFVHNDHIFSLITLPSGSTDEIIKLQDTEFISSIEFSSDQKTICFITGKKKYDNSSLYIVDASTREKSLLFSVDEASTITKPFWSPNSRKFVVLVGYHELETGDFVRYEYYWLKMYDVSTKKLTDLLKVVEPINSISWSKDSNFLAFNGKEKEKFSLYILDTSEKEMLKPVTSLSSDWIFKNLNFWNLSGNKLFFVNGSTVSSFEAKNKKYQLMKDIHKPIITQQWNENQNTVALITKDGEETYLDTLNLETGFLTNIEKRFQVDSPRWSPNGESLSYFIKAKDQTFSKIIILDYLSQKNIWEGDVGEISIYPWDVDPTYSIWSSQSASILFLTKKDDQTQFLSKFSINNNQLMAVTTNWDYIYNFGFSPKDDWIFVTGSRSEKEFIEFVSTEDLSQRIEKRDLIFCEWKLDGVKDGEVKLDSKSTSNKNLPILVITPIGVFFLILLIWLVARHKRQS